MSEAVGAPRGSSAFAGRIAGWKRREMVKMSGGRRHAGAGSVGRSAAKGCTVAAVAAGLALAGQTAAHAQAIERNLPPAPQPGPSTLVTPKPPTVSKNAEPIAGPLTALLILGPEEPTQAAPPPGVHLSQAARLNTPDERRRLSRYLGKTLSRALITRIEADIARYYRAKGFPMLSVSTPEQEVTQGVLEVRVIEFRLGKKTAPGARDPGYITGHVRVRPGDAIDTRLLSQDLDWLNRYPFRKVAAAFTPGTALGGTDLILQTTPSRPFSVSTGYSDSGSQLTGFDRYFAGATVALPFLPDATLSYQFTGSNDLVFSQDRPFNSAPTPRYLSHSGRLIVPTGGLSEIEATYSYVSSNEITDFTAHQVTQEYSVDYRDALSELFRPLPGEGVIGVETRHESGSTLFAGEPVQNGRIDVFQVFIGFSDHGTDALGRTSGDITLHLSPGGVNGVNTDAQFATASMGRSRTAEYGYLSGDLTRYTNLPFGFGYSAQLIGQYAPNPLPLTEQIGVGGPSLVRGYTNDDGVFDSGVVSRNELRTPTFPVISRLLKTLPADALSPFLFVDAAYGKNDYTHGDESPIGAGVGTDYQLGSNLAAGVTAAWALKHEGFSHSGQFRLESHVSLSF